MGHQETYTYQDCGFEFTEWDRNFFHDYNTNETVDYIHLFFQQLESDDSNINRFISESYCKVLR